MLPEGTRYPNLTTLPDDSLLISNGSRDYRGKGDSNNHNARLYRPQTNTLDYAADPQVGRNYHSASMLLPDGRVMIVGSDPLFDDAAGTIPGTFEQRIEIYTPPYLFRGAQPTVGEAPTTLALGRTAEVPTPDAARITSARLMAPMASTHVTDVGQRSIALDMTKTGTGVSVTMPEDRTIAPAGPLHALPRGRPRRAVRGALDRGTGGRAGGRIVTSVARSRRAGDLDGRVPAPCSDPFLGPRTGERTAGRDGRRLPPHRRHGVAWEPRSEWTTRPGVARRWHVKRTDDAVERRCRSCRRRCRGCRKPTPSPSGSVRPVPIRLVPSRAMPGR